MIIRYSDNLHLPCFHNRRQGFSFIIALFLIKVAHSIDLIATSAYLIWPKDILRKYF